MERAYTFREIERLRHADGFLNPFKPLQLWHGNENEMLYLEYQRVQEERIRTYMIASVPVEDIEVKLIGDPYFDESLANLKAKFGGFNATI